VVLRGSFDALINFELIVLLSSNRLGVYEELESDVPTFAKDGD